MATDSLLNDSTKATYRNLADGKSPNMSYPRLGGNVYRYMMAYKKVTIRELAKRMGLTQKRVREVRARGTDSYFNTCEWIEGISQVNPYHNMAGDFFKSIEGW